MQSDQQQILELLPAYFEGSLSEPEKGSVESWKNLSQENEAIFNQMEKVWRSLQLLSEMKRYNPQKALQQVNQKLNQKNDQRWWFIWQRVAAILFVPLLIAAVWLSLRKTEPQNLVAIAPVWHTYTTPPGVKARFYLPDSTLVWLNSSSSISYPSQFDTDIRNVNVTGEIFFDVKHQPEQPFIVGMDNIHVRVLGTRFNVINYEREDRTEVILQSGKVELCSGTTQNLTSLSELRTNELATYSKVTKSVHIKQVNAEKYTAWTRGRLIFQDDPMDEVVRKLNRWFNVEIEVVDPEILEYVYTATFQDETIDQILELLSISAPIRYQIIPRSKQQDDIFTAKRIILRKRR